MYQIHKDVKVDLNIVTPRSIQRYKEYLKKQGNVSEENITNVVRQKLLDAIKDGGIRETVINNIVSEAIEQSAIEAFGMYCDRGFIDEWIETLFVITPEQVEATKDDWENKFSWDEFMRGFFDFFLRLRQPLNRQNN